ncbi:MAG: hypothetical protein AB7V32_04130, partial [Candidatus Berkiella sp.]
NVLIADSPYDFVDPYIYLGDSENPFEFYFGNTQYTTHFEDACGVCWSLVYASESPGFNAAQSLGDYQPYHLVPICASPIEFDTICSYNFNEEYDYGELTYYAQDGYYNYESVFYNEDVPNDYYRIDVDVTAGFVELNGNSLLAFNFNLYVESEYAGNSGYGYNNVTLLVDVPDSMGYDSNYINQFILCNEAYFEDFFSYVVKHSGDIFEHVSQQNELTVDDAIDLATYMLRTYAISADFPSAFPKVAGVLEDNFNNVYGLSFNGSEITTTAFNQAPFSFENIYLTNLQLTSPEDANIVKADLQICYCDEGIFQRFDAYQQANGCESDYGDPRAYIDQYVDAHFVEQGCNRYIEINYAVPTYNEACNGYVEGTTETIRICVDSDITIDQICINSQALFENYYDYGYVYFDGLLNNYNPVVFFENEAGDCYSIQNTDYDFNQQLDGEGEQSYLICNYELAPCECNNEISVYGINDNQNVYANGYGSIQIYANYDESYQTYYINFNYIHDSSGSYIAIEYSVDYADDNLYTQGMIPIKDANLDCCCVIESLVVDENRLYDLILNYIVSHDEQPATLDDFLSMISYGSSFYDCNGNCYEYYTNDQSVATCDTEECCKHDISVIYEPDENQIPTFQIQGVAADESCFDQFFNFEYINCNGLNYIDFTWYYNDYVANDCFTFPIESNHLLISIPDELNISCECPITSLIIPTNGETDYSQLFQNCCNLSDSVYYDTGYNLIDALACDLAVFQSECGENFVLIRDQYSNYELAAIGENYIRTTTLTDENSFGTSYSFSTFTDDLDYALNNGDGLSLRECIILNNLYDEDVDTILLQSGTYYIDIEGQDENQGLTGDFDVLEDVTIVGACYTVIDAQQKDRVFDVINANLTLVNLSAQNGLIPLSEGSLSGIVNVLLDNDEDTASLTLNNASLYNGAAFQGAGVGIRNFSETSTAYLTLLNDSQISYNTTLEYDENSYSDGGGIYAENAFISIQDNSKVYNNYAYNGGGIKVFNSTVEISDYATVINNYATYNGGGIDAVNSVTNLYDNSSILYNQAYNNGGGVNSDAAEINQLDNSMISNNYAYYYGGGAYLIDSALNLYNSSQVSDNLADFESGGGVYGGYSYITLYDDSSINNNSAADNATGGGIYAYGSYIYLYHESNIDSNTAGYGAGLGIDVSELYLYNNSQIIGNIAAINGGGVVAYNNTYISLNHDSQIASNEAQNDGGGVWNNSNNILIDLNNQSQIVSNLADNNGGGIFADNSTINLNGTSTITMNTAGGTGGGIYDNGAASTITGGAAVTLNTPDDIATPLVLDLNHDGKVSLISADDSQVSWDVYNNGVQHKTGWVGPEDGILVYDKDGDKAVTDISEFMLSMYHDDAKTDLDGLRLAFDSNHDMVFDNQDTHFNDFGVWQDLNSDGKTDDGEYKSLIDWGILSISLASDNNSSIQDGNIIFGSTTYKTVDGAEYRAGDVGLGIGDALDIKDVIKPQDSINNLSSPASSIPAQSTCTTDLVVNEQVCLPPVPVQIQIEEQPVVNTLAA